VHRDLMVDCGNERQGKVLEDVFRWNEEWIPVGMGSVAEWAGGAPWNGAAVE
jgi:hypothetical protein